MASIISNAYRAGHLSRFKDFGFHADVLSLIQTDAFA